ncbi:MAG TPA: serine hydrolase domain-containing protein [Flavitalea sp.]|nr:serine hydrolase domain-containing protein [Flavitalea sp.]
MSYKIHSNCLMFISGLIFMLFFQSASAQNDLSELDLLIEEKKAQLGGQVAVVVWSGDSIAYQKQTGELTVNSQEPIGFASAWLTAALVMTFVDQGKLSLDDPVAKYLPIYSKYAKKYLTIRHCLANTTGLEGEKGGVQKLFQKTRFDLLEEQVNSFASGREIIRNPGEAFSYNNIGSNIAGRVLEVVGKKAFDRLMQERIFRPLGMRRSSFSMDMAVNPASGAVSTPSDYIKFLAMLLNKGTFNGKTILSEAAVAEMQKIQTNGVPSLFTPKATEGFDYGLGAWIQEQNDKGEAIILSSPGLLGGWPYIDNLRKYACIIFVPSKGKEAPREPYLQIMDALRDSF